MFLCLAFTLLFQFSYSDAASNETYVYHLRRNDFIDAEILRRMLPAVDVRVEMLCRMMELNCRFDKATTEYESLQRSAVGCVTNQDRRTLQQAISGFRTSREECIAKADCKSGLTDAINKTLVALQTLDTESNKEVEACGTDESCKYKVYQKTHTNTFSQYVSTRPELRLLADQSLASEECAGAIVNCMVTSNEAALRNVYKGSALLRECQDGDSPTIVMSSYTRPRPPRKHNFSPSGVTSYPSGSY